MKIQLAPLHITAVSSMHAPAPARPERVHIADLNSLSPKAALSVETRPKVLKATNSKLVFQVKTEDSPAATAPAKAGSSTEQVVIPNHSENAANPLDTSQAAAKAAAPPTTLAQQDDGLHGTSVISHYPSNEGDDAPIISLRDLEAPPVNKPTPKMAATESSPDLSTFSAPDFYLPSMTMLAITAVFTMIFLFYKKNSLLSSRLQATAKSLAIAEDELQTLKERLDQTRRFQANLSDAGLTTRLQQPRSVVRHEEGSARSPERYNYVRTLAQRGIKPEEIAAMLAISPQEASQLVSLSKIAASPS